MEEKAKITVAKEEGLTGSASAVGHGLTLTLTFTLNVLVVMAFTIICSVAASAARAADEPVLKPDVPKFDATDSPDRSTLKGTIEHRMAVPPPAPKKAKKLNSSASSNKPTDFQLSGAQRAQRDRERVLKARAQEQALNARQPFTIEQSVGIIGVKFHKLPDGPAVINTVFAGTPAAKAGMHVDDQIVAVDGVPTRNLNKDQCYDLIVGSPNTPVTLSVLRRQNFDVKQMVRMDFNDIPDPLVRRDYLNSL
jgi:hypothetical protein